MYWLQSRQDLSVFVNIAINRNHKAKNGDNNSVIKIFSFCLERK